MTRKISGRSKKDSIPITRYWNGHLRKFGCTSFSHNLPINNTYKKGNSRAGCLFCPMGGGKSDSFRYLCYKNEIDKYTDIIRDTIADKNINTYITNGGWIERKNGRGILLAMKRSTLKR